MTCNDSETDGCRRVPSPSLGPYSYYPTTKTGDYGFVILEMIHRVFPREHVDTRVEEPTKAESWGRNLSGTILR